jgi:uncharacterized protein YjbJ (UPF0337 family)
MQLHMHKFTALLRVELLLRSMITWIAGLFIPTLFLFNPVPAMALPSSQAPASLALVGMPTVATMANQAKAAAKDAEGKLESAYGDITGDAGRQIKGKAKQGQSSAMKAGDAIKEGIESIEKNAR